MIDWIPVLVSFLLGVVATGAGAVLTQRVIEDRRRGALHRALVVELRENAHLAGRSKGRTTAPARTVRGAWDAAHELDFTERELEALAIAYSAGEDLNSRVEILDRVAGAPYRGDPGSEAYRQAGRHEKAVSDSALDAADRARQAFEAAIAVLTKRP